MSCLCKDTGIQYRTHDFPTSVRAPDRVWRDSSTVPRGLRGNCRAASSANGPVDPARPGAKCTWERDMELSAPSSRWVEASNGDACTARWVLLRLALIVAEALRLRHDRESVRCPPCAAAITHPEG
jgi:hypothetical protein